MNSERRNLLSYYANFIVVAILGLVVNPLLLGFMGVAGFGLWKTLQRYLDIASVADGRSAQSLKWLIASRMDATPNERQRLIGASIAVWTIWLPAVAAISTVMILGLDVLIPDLPQELNLVARTTAVVLLVNVVLSGLLSTPDSVLVGANQGYRSMLVTTLVLVLSNFAMVLSARIGGGPDSLAWIVLVSAAVNALITWIVMKRSLPWARVARPTLRDVGHVSAFSVWTLVWAGVEKLLLSSELIFFSLTLGLAAVSAYTFTTYVGTFVLTIGLITASSFTPKIGALFGSDRVRRASGIVLEVRWAVIGISVLGFSGILAFNSAFVSMWAGGQNFQGTELNVILAALMFVTGLIRLDGQLADAVLSMRAKALVGIFFSVIGVVVGVWVYDVWRSTATALAAMLVSRILFLLILRRILTLSIRNPTLPTRFWTSSVTLILASFAIGAILDEWGGSSLWLGIAALLWLSGAVVAIQLGVVPRTVRDQIFARVRRGYRFVRRGGRE